jgi:hypothetical protein
MLTFLTFSECFALHSDGKLETYLIPYDDSVLVLAFTIPNSGKNASKVSDWSSIDAIPES